MSEQKEKTTTVESPISSKYVLVTVEKTEAPEGLPGNNWHEYIIERGNSQIIGKKPGTLKNVTEHAKAIIVDLNERSGIPSSSTYASRQISKTPAKTPPKSPETTPETTPEKTDNSEPSKENKS